MNLPQKILAALLALSLSLCFLPADSHAAAKDVTASMKKDKNLKKIVKLIAPYATGQVREKKKETETFQGYQALSAAANVSYSNGLGSSFTKKEIQKLTYDLFGIKPGTKSIPAFKSSRRKWIAKTPYSSGKPYVYSGGDWGARKPRYKIQKIQKVKTNVYDVTIINQICYADENGRIEKIGKTCIRLKKNKKSSYRYTITRLKYL
ncbi:MAG TPA: hypothetical protein DF613_02405 [Lachnospiraceae bacterium]|nr:hypothetical protein [Lachnospiraceae bacterium]